MKFKTGNTMENLRRVILMLIAVGGHSLHAEGDFKIPNEVSMDQLRELRKQSIVQDQKRSEADRILQAEKKSLLERLNAMLREDTEVDPDLSPDEKAKQERNFHQKKAERFAAILEETRSQPNLIRDPVFMSKIIELWEQHSNHMLFTYSENFLKKPYIMRKPDFLEHYIGFSNNFGPSHRQNTAERLLDIPLDRLPHASDFADLWPYLLHPQLISALDPRNPSNVETLRRLTRSLGPWPTSTEKFLDKLVETIKSPGWGAHGDIISEFTERLMRTPTETGAIVNNLLDTHPYFKKREVLIPHLKRWLSLEAKHNSVFKNGASAFSYFYAMGKGALETRPRLFQDDMLKAVVESEWAEDLLGDYDQRNVMPARMKEILDNYAKKIGRKGGRFNLTVQELRAAFQSEPASISSCKAPLHRLLD